MNLVQVRVDDRLVHGQVVLGCCPALGARRVLVCSDEVAGDPLLARIYTAAAPPGIQVEIIGRGAALSQLAPDHSADSTPTILVTASPSDLRWLVDHGVPFRAINVGGLHQRVGAHEIWPGVFLTPSDREDLRALMGRGVHVSVQTVPGAPTLEATTADLDHRGGIS